MMAVRGLGLAAIMLLGAALPTAAQSLYTPEPFAGIVDELRFGLHAHQVHHAALPFMVSDWDISRVEDISFDVLFTSPDLDVFRWIGSPRPELGTTINLAGRDSLLHLGLTWHLPVFDTPLFLEGTLGAAANNGYLTGAPAGRQNFGCRVNFYQRYGVGVNLSEQATATVTYEHTSNNGWCGEANDGLSNFGVRLGWKF
ncbi:Lipid A 3-O-deacylase (PagL) [Devosia limi DSM 17137]|uniref:Lipid A 3-O-deacylase (PagL) n=1 Tax=Devosia limi DSM 17137 TaxID=1121477 RepID=A0A1M4Z9K7_9HYPH|nr:Lipid A 3-O-deacylase (PagL) [Devosia limi DSM 17137]